MSLYLCLSFRLFDGLFHGRGDGGGLEWPPSPLRAFQALVAAAGQRWRNDQLFNANAREPLTLLEGLDAPELIAPAGVPSSTAYRLYVPNNHADIVASAWTGGDPHANIAEHKVEKHVHPVRLKGGNDIHYLWPIGPDQTEHVRTLSEIARGVSHLGWGIDQAAASFAVISAEKVSTLKGERWIPADQGGILLRVPEPAGPASRGTLADLRGKHEAFLKRLSRDGFKPVPPLSAFRVVGYRRAIDPAGRAWAAFEILKPEAVGKASFDTARRCRDVAAWVRNLTGEVCRDWSDVATFVHGHDPADSLKPLAGEKADERFMYLPLPTINHGLNRVESIRRVLIAAPVRFRDRVERVRRRLPGQDLIDERRRVPVGVLNLLPRTDWVLRQYTEQAAVWSTVTPVIRPGHDDGIPNKAERLLRAAFAQAGFPEPTEVDWRRVGFRAGADLADRYAVPDQLGKYPRYHVRVRFPEPVRGPLVVGAGRYRGIGVFAAEKDG